MFTLQQLVDAPPTEVADGRTRLDYRSVGLSDEQQVPVESGVATMLGRLAAYFTQ